MKATFLTLALILVLGGGAYYLVYYAPNGIPLISGGGALRLNPAVYPLYGGVTWRAPYLASENGLSGIEMNAVTVNDTMDIGAITTPFSAYYEQLLASSGWQKDLAREAGGPGSSVEAYVKGSSHILVMYSSVFKVQSADAPEQCPCNVTLTLFSTNGDDQL